MQIDEWKREDNKQIAELEKVCFEYAWSLEMVEETSSLKNFCGVVARESEADNCRDLAEKAKETDAVIGYAGAIYAFDSADVALVAVSPKRRRLGYGASLLKSLLKKLEKLGVKNVFLEVRVTNESAKNLYKKMGFSTVGIRKKYYENGEDALVMVRELPFEL